MARNLEHKRYRDEDDSSQRQVEESKSAPLSADDLKLQNDAFEVFLKLAVHPPPPGNPPMIRAPAHELLPGAPSLLLIPLQRIIIDYLADIDLFQMVNQALQQGEHFEFLISKLFYFAIYDLNAILKKCNINAEKFQAALPKVTKFNKDQYLQLLSLCWRSLYSHIMHQDFKEKKVIVHYGCYSATRTKDASPGKQLSLTATYKSEKSKKLLEIVRKTQKEPPIKEQNGILLYEAATKNEWEKVYWLLKAAIRWSDLVESRAAIDKHLQKEWTRNPVHNSELKSHVQQAAKRLCIDPDLIKLMLETGPPDLFKNSVAIGRVHHLTYLLEESLLSIGSKQTDDDWSPLLEMLWQEKDKRFDLLSPSLIPISCIPLESIEECFKDLATMKKNLLPKSPLRHDYYLGRITLEKKMILEMEFALIKALVKKQDYSASDADKEHFLKWITEGITRTTSGWALHYNPKFIKFLISVYQTFQDCCYFRRQHPWFDQTAAFFMQQPIPYPNTQIRFIEILQGQAIKVKAIPAELHDELMKTIFHPEHAKYGVTMSRCPSVPAAGDAKVFNPS